MKGKEGLKGDALRLIWLKGGLWRGWVGGGLHPEINESPELQHVAHVRRTYWSVEKVLKATVKVAIGVKCLTLHFTTRCHSFAKIHKLLKSKRVINCYLTI